MATYKSTVNRGYTLRLVITPLTQTSTDINNNQTRVDYGFYLDATINYFQALTSTASLTINGTVVYTLNAQVSFPGTNSTLTLATGTRTIPHNSDGTKSLSVSGWFETNTKPAFAPSARMSLSGSENLKTIPRTSTFTIPSSFTMGNEFIVSITPASETFTHWVEMWDGSTILYSSGHTIDLTDGVNVALSTLAARSPNSMSRTFSVKVSTYNDNINIGTTSQNIIGYVPSTAKPTISAITVSENESSVASLVGAYVQTKSRLNLAITGASGIYGSTIRSYNISGLGLYVNASSTLTDYLSVSGNQTIKGTVTDSRGQTFDKSLVIYILPYAPPTLSNLSFRRTLPNKTEAPLGTSVTVTANVNVHSLIAPGGEKNSIKYQVQSARTGYSFTDKTNTTDPGLTKSYSDVWSGYSVDFSYNFRVRAGDVFGFGGWSVGLVPTGIVTQQWGRSTTSFGKMIDSISYNVQVGTGGIQSDGGYFKSDGSALFSGLASEITSGTFATARIPGLPGSQITSGTISSSRIPALPASQITSGIIADSRLPAYAKPADYVVDYGTNYTKWDSGKLEQGILISGTASASTSSTINGSFPVTFTSTTTMVASIRTASLNAAQVTLNRAIQSGSSGVNVTVSNTRSAAQNVEIYVAFVGRWKY